MTVETIPPPDAPPPAGVLPSFLERLFGPSWKTSCLGVLSLVAAVLPIIPGVPAPVVEVAKTVLPFLTGGGLLAAKDRDVTGGTRR